MYSYFLPVAISYGNLSANALQKSSEQSTSLLSFCSLSFSSSSDWICGSLRMINAAQNFF